MESKVNMELAVDGFAVTPEALQQEPEPDPCDLVEGSGPVAAGAPPGVRGKAMVPGGATTRWPHWTTPASILDGIVRKMGVIVLDPCSNPASIVNPAQAWDGVAEDGLAEDWIAAIRFARSKLGDLVVFVNPPFSGLGCMGDGGLGPWTAKILAEGERISKISELHLIFLGPAKTDTRWWHRLARSNDAGLYVEGRTTFGNPPPGVDGTSPAGATYIGYWGMDREKFIEIAEPFGLAIRMVAP